MFKWSTISGVGVTALFAASSPAFADLSGMDVWGSWKKQLGNFGYDVSAQENSTGGTLSVSNLVLSRNAEDESNRVRAEISELTFEDQSDGSVVIRFPATMTAQVNSEFEGEQSSSTIEITYDQLDLKASGDLDNISYTYSADGIGAALSELLVEGEPLANAEFDLSLANVKGSSKMSGTASLSVAQEFFSENMTLSMNFEDAEEGAVDLDVSAQSLSFTGTGTIPEVLDMDNPRAALRDGLVVDGTYGIGPMTLKASGVDEEGQAAGVEATAASANVAVSLGNDGFEYGGNYNGIEFSYVGDELGFPFTAQMQSYNFDVGFPLRRNDVPQDFNGSFSLSAVTLSDAIWGLFDPAAKLPRDPAEISMAVNGTVTLFEDLLPEDTMDPSEDFPGEINSLDISEIVVTLLGIDLKGDGGFTFDNTDLETFDGMPRPQGELTLNLTGANALMATLEEMGLVPADQIMGARMMMGLFAVPVGEDQIESTLSIDESGSVFANGQQLQ